MLPGLTVELAVVVVRHSQRGEGRAEQAGRGEVGGWSSALAVWHGGCIVHTCCCGCCDVAGGQQAWQQVDPLLADPPQAACGVQVRPAGERELVCLWACRAGWHTATSASLLLASITDLVQLKG